MAVGFKTWFCLNRASRLVAVLVCVAAASLDNSARAERSTFVTDGADRGLSDLDGTSLSQDRAGDILVATEHGVFAYDGRRFENLGPAQGLPDGGEVFGLAISANGRVAVAFPGEVYVSDRPSSRLQPVTTLQFRMVAHPGVSFYNARPRRLAAWGDGFVFLANDELVQISDGGNTAPQLNTLPYDRSESSLLSGAAAVFSVDGRLWETFEDGRVCSADPGLARCYATADGLTDGPWLDVVGDGHGRVMARSVAAVAVLDPTTQRWSISAPPDQGGSYDAYTRLLGLFRTPDGRIITQSSQGLDVLGPQGWRELSVADGAPSGTIVDALTDATGQLWFYVAGRGLVRWVGYGHWDTIEKSDGLSAGYPWQTARSADGHLWVSTDSGVDEFSQDEATVRLVRQFPVSSYALAISPSHQVWAGWRNKGLREIDPVTGTTTIVRTPPVDTIVPDASGATWLGTEAGLSRIGERDQAPFHPLLVGDLKTAVNSIKPDGQGGVFYLCAGRLRHFYRDGRDVVVTGRWPKGTFEPLAMAMAPNGVFWIGGPGGLLRAVVAQDQVVQLTAIPTDDIRSTSVFALTVDHRGWIWVGTDQGLSIFNGLHWVSVDASAGLLSNDVNQDGIREDRDGSIYVVTSHGISHLRDPSVLFKNDPISVVVTNATFGSHPYRSKGVSFTREPLVIALGTPNHGVERSVIFKYRLSGVDTAWVESLSGIVRYPFVSPGHHRLTVIGYDSLSHRISAPVILKIDVGYEWWRQWWAICLWISSAAALLYLGMRVRFRAMYAQQAELERRVDDATARIRHQAAHDEMTGLLVRREVEQRLAKKLDVGGGRNDLVVALLDVDHFKSINDTCGHLGGDEVLRAMGRIIRRHLRDGEFAGRYGGEEALLAFNDRDGDAAERVLNLHLAIRHDTFNAGGKPIRVTCSIGVAWAVADDSWETLIGRADKALYEAKHGGRDRVVESRHQVTPVLKI